MATRRYEQRLRAEAAEETRRRILDALYARLKESPTRPVSVDEVARLARVSRSTVYLVFGSRAGLFRALVLELRDGAGYERIVEAVQHPDAREGLRGGIEGSVRMYDEHREVLRVLMALSRLDPDAVGGAVQEFEQLRAAGIARLCGRLEEQGLLRPGMSAEEAAHVNWLLAGFDAYEELAARDVAADAISRIFVQAAERTLLRDP